MTTNVTSVVPKNAITSRDGSTATTGAGGWLYDQSGVTYEQAGLLYDGGPLGAAAITSVVPKNSVVVNQ